MNKLRLMYGLYWTGKYPNLVKEALIIAACILAYGFVSYVDELGDRAAMMEQDAASKVAYEEVMLTCLNGGAFAFKDTGKAFYCSVQEI